MLLEDLGEGPDRRDPGQHGVAELHQRGILAQPVAQRHGGVGGVAVGPVQLDKSARPVRAAGDEIDRAVAVGRAERQRAGDLQDVLGEPGVLDAAERADLEAERSGDPPQQRAADQPFVMLDQV